MTNEPSPLKDAIMDAVYVPLERDDMQTPCALPFMTSSKYGVCDGDGCPVSDESIASALNAVAKIQTEYYRVKKEPRKETQKGMTAEASPRPWRLLSGPSMNHIIAANSQFVCDVYGHSGSTRELDKSNAELIVAAVNKHGMPIVELIRGYDALEAERDRLKAVCADLWRTVKRIEADSRLALGKGPGVASSALHYVHTYASSAIRAAEKKGFAP